MKFSVLLPEEIQICFCCLKVWVLGERWLTALKTSAVAKVEVF